MDNVFNYTKIFTPDEILVMGQQMKEGKKFNSAIEFIVNRVRSSSAPAKELPGVESAPSEQSNSTVKD